jgi:hypothetical protein
MTGCDNYNYDIFNSTARELRQQGYDVINPAENDIPQGLSLDIYLQHDLSAVCKCDAIALIAGWQLSNGARIETFVALSLGKPIYDAFTMQLLDKDFVKSVLTNYVEER